MFQIFDIFARFFTKSLRVHFSRSLLNINGNMKIMREDLSTMWMASIAAPGLAKTREFGQYIFKHQFHSGKEIFVKISADSRYV